jgi:hypothetical protein
MTAKTAAISETKERAKSFLVPCFLSIITDATALSKANSAKTVRPIEAA